MTEIETYTLHAPACLDYINACWSDSMSLAWTRMRLSRHAPCLFCQGFTVSSHFRLEFVHRLSCGQYFVNIVQRTCLPTPPAEPTAPFWRGVTRFHAGWALANSCLASRLKLGTPRVHIRGSTHAGAGATASAWAVPPVLDHFEIRRRELRARAPLRCCSSEVPARRRTYVHAEDGRRTSVQWSSQARRIMHRRMQTVRAAGARYRTAAWSAAWSAVGSAVWPAVDLLLCQIHVPKHRHQLLHLVCSSYLGRPCVLNV